MIANLLLLCITLLSAKLVYAENFLALNLPINNSAISNESANTKISTLTQPENLQSGWWDYFDVSDELLAKRISETKQHYTPLIQNLSSESNQIANTHLITLLSNLEALRTLREPNHISSTVNEAIVYQTQYSIAEWLASANELNKAQWRLQERQTQLDNEVIALDAAQSRLNALMLDYIALKQVDSNKLILGLSIMAKRAALAVGEEQFKINKTLIEQQRNQVSVLQTLLKIATQRLSSDKSFVAQKEQELQALQLKIEPTQSAARKALIDTLGVIEQTPRALSEARLYHQQAINAMIDEAALKLAVTVASAKKSLAVLLLGQTDDIKTLRDDWQSWQSWQTAQQQNTLNWNKETRDELEQVRDTMIRSNGDSNDNAMNALLKQRLKTAQNGLIILKQMEVDNDELNQLMQEMNNRFIERSGKLSLWFDWAVVRLMELKVKLLNLWIDPLFSVGDTPVTTAGIVRVIVILTIAALISKIFQRVMRHLTERREQNEHGHISVFYTVGRLAHYLILFIGLIVALSSIGLDFSNLALVAGALSVGIGFGLQSIVNNFVSGLILLFEGTIKVGDFIELDNNVSGVVYEINVRSTQLRTPDSIDIIVPNSILASRQVINWTLHEANRRIHIPFSVAYGTDKKLVETAVLEATTHVRYTHQPVRGKAAQCWLVKLGDNGLEFELVVWINKEAIKNPQMVQAAYLWEIESCLNKYHIEIPFPQYDVHIHRVNSRVKS